MVSETVYFEGLYIISCDRVHVLGDVDTADSSKTNTRACPLYPHEIANIVSRPVSRHWSLVIDHVFTRATIC